MSEEKKHNDEINAKIVKLQAEIEELRSQIKPLPKHENPPLHLLNASSRKGPKTQKAVKLKAPEPAKKEAKPKKRTKKEG